MKTLHLLVNPATVLRLVRGKTNHQDRAYLIKIGFADVAVAGITDLGCVDRLRSDDAATQASLRIFRAFRDVPTHQAGSCAESELITEGIRCVALVACIICTHVLLCALAFVASLGALVAMKRMDPSRRRMASACVMAGFVLGWLPIVGPLVALVLYAHVMIWGRRV